VRIGLAGSRGRRTAPSLVIAALVVGLAGVVGGCGTRGADVEAKPDPAGLVLINDTGKTATITDCSGADLAPVCKSRLRLQLAPGAIGTLPFAPPGSSHPDIAEIRGVWAQVRCILVPPGSSASGGDRLTTLRAPLSEGSNTDCGAYDQSPSPPIIGLIPSG
jgi:hypothetical protein